MKQPLFQRTPETIQKKRTHLHVRGRQPDCGTRNRRDTGRRAEPGSQTPDPTCHKMALVHVPGADCCGNLCAGRTHLGGPGGRIRPKIQGKPNRKSPARLPSSTSLEVWAAPSGRESLRTSGGGRNASPRPFLKAFLTARGPPTPPKRLVSRTPQKGANLHSDQHANKCQDMLPESATQNPSKRLQNPQNATACSTFFGNSHRALSRTFNRWFALCGFCNRFPGHVSALSGSIVKHCFAFGRFAVGPGLSGLSGCQPTDDFSVFQKRTGIEQLDWVPESNLAGVFVHHDMALELVCGG